MKRLSILVLMLLVLATVIGCAPAPAPAPTPTIAPIPTPVPQTTKASASPVVLKLDGSSGSKSLTLDDLKALPAVEGWAGLKSSTGKITIPERYKGVAVDELCKLVGERWLCHDGFL